MSLISDRLEVAHVDFSIYFFLHFTLQKKIKVASDLRHKEGQVKLLVATEVNWMGADSQTFTESCMLDHLIHLKVSICFKYKKSLIIQL